jgi:hypothetical protein
VVQPFRAGGSDALGRGLKLLRKLGLPQLYLLHNSSSTIRSSDTSVQIHLASGFGRDTRLPVFGSLMKRRRVQTSTPLLTTPLLLQACPRIVVSPQVRPNGPGMLGRDGGGRFARGEFPEDAADNHGLCITHLAFASNRARRLPGKS